VLEEDGTLVVDEDDVVKELENNTVVIIVNNQDAWKPVASAANVSINKAARRWEYAIGI
jgi:hypothetical protein